MTPKADKHSTMKRDDKMPRAPVLAALSGEAASDQISPLLVTTERSTWSKTEWRSVPTVRMSGCWGSREVVVQ